MQWYFDMTLFCDFVLSIQLNATPVTTGYQWQKLFTFAGQGSRMIHYIISPQPQPQPHQTPEQTLAIAPAFLCILVHSSVFLCDALSFLQATHRWT